MKNFYDGSTPQQAYSVGIDWAAPGMWLFNINCAWMGYSYVDIYPVRHKSMLFLCNFVDFMEELENLTREITTQEKLNDAFILNASVGKLIYINR